MDSLLTPANRRRGEVAARLDGRDYRLRLTLGALAELEDAFGVEDLQALVARLSSGRFAARDLVRIIGAGLRGAGHDIADSDVAAMSAEDGVAGQARLAMALLAAAFGTPETAGNPARP
ncbi:transfer Agent [Zhengella mangrovi]|uniref:Transfer Agent n=1 Tax=Zhengella mangrovi TaxID=1982044 RepID=A0A2G1QS80_9HYPH|nr:gene transfer agent family protein [Zhengella mangrovi]PHP68352.1 transfer Agent [Zhengella mangrovi]